MNPKNLSEGWKILTGILLLSALVPASYIGNVAAKRIAESSGTGGPVVAAVVVGLAALVLGCLGAAAIAVATKWPRVFPVSAGGGLLALTAVSLWMFNSLAEAREGLFVFVVTAAALSLIVLFIKLFGGRKVGRYGPRASASVAAGRSDGLPVVWHRSGLRTQQPGVGGLREQIQWPA